MPAYRKIGLFIDGEWRDGEDRSVDVINPADETALARLPFAGATDLDQALRAAERGFSVWKQTAPARRTAVMMRAAQLVRERATRRTAAPRLRPAANGSAIGGSFSNPPSSRGFHWMPTYSTSNLSARSRRWWHSTISMTPSRPPMVCRLGLRPTPLRNQPRPRRGSRIVSINHFGGPAPELPFGGEGKRQRPRGRRRKPGRIFGDQDGLTPAGDVRPHC
jgi:hypothetical protein